MGLRVQLLSEYPSNREVRHVERVYGNTINISLSITSNIDRTKALLWERNRKRWKDGSRCSGHHWCLSGLTGWVVLINYKMSLPLSVHGGLAMHFHLLVWASPDGVQSQLCIFSICKYVSLAQFLSDCLLVSILTYLSITEWGENVYSGMCILKMCIQCKF